MGNNILNLTSQEEIRDVINELGLNLSALEEAEPDWALGNGGLGRFGGLLPG